MHFSKEVLFCCVLIFASSAKGELEGAVIVSGNATVTYSQNHTVITQNSENAILDWRKFNIAAHETVRFQQPSVNSITLNRVIGGEASIILGQLSANGKIILVNQAGIVFGNGAQVDVGGLIATTAEIANKDFLDGNLNFKQNPGDFFSVMNYGNITAREGGIVALIAPAVHNQGTIQARLGRVELAAGTEFTVDFYGDQLINLSIGSTINKKVSDQFNNSIQAGVSNTGKIFVDGGKTVIQTKVAGEVLDNVINLDGIIEANSIVEKKGQIILLGGEEGIVKVSGKIEARGKNKNEKGGEVLITGSKVEITNNADIDASGIAGGGIINIGGNKQGKGALQKSEAVYVAKGSCINADAILHGDGGEVILWSEKATQFFGNITAKGGLVNGNGGLIETSSKKWANFGGDVNASAPKGLAGTWIFDPTNVNIVAGSVNSNGAFGGGNPQIWTPTTTSPSNIGVNNIVGFLNTGTNVTITTSSAGVVDQGNISVQSSVVTSTAAGTQFTLIADNNITFNSGVNITTQGNATFTAGLAGTFTNLGTNNLAVSGTTTITAPGGISFPNAFTLAGPMILNSSGANGNITLSGTVNGAQSLTLSAGTGTITLGGIIGGTTALSSVTVNSAALLNSTSITTTGAIQITPPVSLSANTTYGSGAGNITFGSTIVSGGGVARTLTLNSIGTTTISGVVGAGGGTNPLSTLTTNAGGTTQIGGNITTTNAAIVFNDNVTLLGDAVFSAGSGAITFGGTLNGARNLTLNSTGATTFNNIIGGTIPLLSLTTNAGGTAVFAAACTSVITTGASGIKIGEAVTFNGLLTTLDSSAGNGPIVLTGAVTLGGDLTATAGSGGITFGSTVSGAKNLSVTSSGIKTFSGIVGGTALLSFTTNATGSTSIGANITTTGPIIFNDPITLNANVLISSGAGLVTFGSTVDGARTLTVNSTGVTTFSGNIGSLTPLLSLTTNAGGSTLIGGNVSTTNGAVVFNDAVTLTANSIINSGTGLVTFLNTVNGGFGLTINSSGVTTFTGIVGGATPLLSLTTNVGGSTSIGANISTTDGAIIFNDPVTLAANSIITSGTGLVTFGSTVNGARTLTVNSSGVTTFTGIVGGATPLTGLTMDAGGSTSIGANISTTNGAIIFNDPVTLTSSVLISSGTGLVTFGSTVDGPGSLTVNSTGATTFNNIIGGTTPLLRLTTNAGGTSVFAAACTSVITSGASGISIGDPVTFNGLSTTLNSSSGNGSIILTGAVTLNGNLTLTSGNGLMTFGSTVNGTKTLTASAGTGTITFSGILGGTNALSSLIVNSASLVNMTSVTTTGLIQITPAVSLSANTTYRSGAGDITFGSTIVSGGGVNRTLTLNSTGTTTLTGAIGGGGGTNALSTLTTNAVGTTIVGGNITTTNAAVVFNDNVTLLSHAVFSTGSGAITFGGTLNGARNLTLNSTGATTFNNIIGGTTPLLSLTTNAGGTSVFAAACTSVVTSSASGINIGDPVTFNAALTTLNSSAGNGPIALTGAVTLSGDLTATAGSGAITFGSTVSGARNLIVTSSGIKTFSGIVGGTALLSVTTNAAGSTSISANITTTGPIIFNDPVTLAANSVISSGAGLVTFGSTIDGPGSLTVNSTGTTTFNNIIGANAPLLGLTTNVGGTSVFASACTSVKSNGAVGITIGETVTFNGLLTTLDSSAGNGPIVLTGAVTLNGNLTVTSGNGLMTFGSTVNGTKTLTASAGTGTITFSGILGGTNALTSLIVNSASLVNMTSVTTTGLIQITPAVSLSANTTYASGGGDITFGSTIVSGGGVNRTLTLNSTGTTTLTGAIGAGGGTNALSTLTTNAVGTTVVGGNITTTNAAIVFNDNVTLLGDAVFSTGSGAITFGGTLNGARNLTLNSTGATTFNNIIGGTTPLLSLTTNAGGTSVFAAACTSVVTSGVSGINIGDPVTFNAALTTLDSSTGNGPIVLTGAVTLNGNLTVTSGNGLMTFGSTVNGTKTLTASAGTGTITFSGILGATNALTSLIVNSASLVNMTSVTTTGLIQITPAVSLSANTTYGSGAGDITFGSTIVSGGGVNRTLTLNSTGTTTFTGAIGAGGGTNALSTLTTNAVGTTVVGGNITTTNAAIVFNDNVTLLGDAVFSTGSGAITFGGTLNGARNLTLNSTGATTFNNIIGGTTPLLSLTTNAGGTSVFAAACTSVVTSGVSGINIGDPVTFNAALTTLNSSTGNGPIALTGAVTLSGNLTATAGSGAVTFGSTVSGARNLIVTSSGIKTFSGIVGGTALLSVTTNAAGSTSIGANISTTGPIIFNDPVTFAANSIISSGAGLVTFGSTIDGPGSLTVNSTGATTFNNIIGGTTPLLSLTTNAGGTSVFAAACTSVVTSGVSGINIGDPVTFNAALTTLDSSTGNGPIVLTGAVTLNGDLTLTSGNGLMTFGSTVNGTKTLTASAGTGTITFSGILGGTNALTSLIVNSASLVNMTSVTITGLIQITPAVSLSANTTYTSSAGDITFGSTIVSGGGVVRTLTLNSTGTTTLTGAIGAGGGTNALSTLTTNAVGTTVVGGNITTTNAAIVFNDNVTLLGDAVFSTGSGAITFGGALNGAGNLTLNSTGTTTFNNVVGGTTPLLSLTTNAGGTSVFSAACTGVTTSGALGIDIENAVTFNAALTTLNSSTGNGPVALIGAVTLSGDLTATAGSGAVTFGSTVSGARNLIVTSSGIKTFSGIVGGTALLSFTTNAAGSTFLGANITTTGPIIFNDPVTLAANSIISSGAGLVTFGSTIDGPGSLTVNSTGATTFNNVIGANVPLLGLTTNVGGTAVFAAACTSVKSNGAVGINIGEAVTFNGLLTTLDSSAGNGPIVLTGAVTLNGNLTLTSGNGLMTFGSTVNGTKTLTASAGTGTITFSGILGGTNALTSLIVNSAFLVNMTSVTTTGLIQITPAVSLSTNTTFTSSTGDITFGSTIVSGGGVIRTLTLNSPGTTTLTGVIGAGGGTNALSTLTTNVGGTTVVGGNITTTNAAIVFNDNVTLLGDAVFSTGSGAITFGGTLNGARNLTLDSTGTSTFNNVVGGTTPLLSLTMNAGGTSVFAAACTSVVTSGASGINIGDPVTFNAALTTLDSSTGNGPIVLTGAVTLNGNLTVTSGNGLMTFGSTINGAQTLTASAGTGTINFNGVLGGTNALTSLIVNSASLVNMTSVTTTGLIQITPAVSLSTNTTFTSSTGDITFGSTIVSGGGVNRTLTLNSTGTTTLTGAIGAGCGTNALSTLTTNAVGTTVVGGDITTTNADIAFNDSVTLLGDSVFSTGSGAITFGGTLDGPRNLTLDSTGTTTFNNVVGGTTPLLSLTTNAGGTSVFAAACTGVTTSGALGIDIENAVTFNAALTTLDSSAGNGPIVLTGAVTLNGDLTLTSGNGLMTFGSTVNGTKTLTASAGTGTITFSGIVGGTNALTSLIVNSASLVNMTSVTTTGLIQITPAVSLSTNTIFTSSTGDITFGGTIVSGGGVNRTLTLNSTGTTTLTGAIGAGGGTNALSTLTTNAVGTTVVGGDITTTNADIGFNDNVTLLSDAVFSTGSGAITFGGTLDGPRNLTLNSTGTTTFNNVVGGTTPLLSLTTNAGGTSVFAAVCTSVVTSGASGINIGDPVTFNAALTTLNSSTGNGPISLIGAVTLGGDLTATAGSGAVTFGSTVSGARNLIVTSSGIKTFSGIVGGTALLSLTTNATGSTSIGANISTTNGPIVFNDPVTLAANTVISAGTGLVTFGSTVDGAKTLTVNSSGLTTFTGIVGGITPLLSLTTDAVGSTSIGANISTTDGAIIFNDPVTLAGDAILSSGTGAITFGSTINGARNLTLNSTSTTTFNNIVGGSTPLLSLTTDLGGTSIFAAACTGVTTSGALGIGEAVTFNALSTTLNSSSGNGPIVLTGAVTLNGDLTATSGSGAITFGNTINGARNLIANSSGLTTFTGIVGGITPLLSLTTDAVGSTSIGGNISTTNGPIIFNDPVSLTANTIISAGTGLVTFGSTVDGAKNLTVNSLGVKTFAGVVGGTIGLTSLSTDAVGSTLIGANISTTNGAITFNDPVTLAGDAILSSGTGAITFGSTINGAGNVIVNSSGFTTFSGIVGGTTPLLSLTTDAGGSTSIGASITTSNGPIIFNNPVTLVVNTLLSTGTGLVTFGSTIDGANTLTVNSSGVTTFAGIVGGATPLLSLTTDVAGSVSIGANINTSGLMQFNSPATLLGNTTLNSGGGDVNFNNILDGNFNINFEIGLGNIFFADTVGGITPLKNILVSSVNNLRTASYINVEKFYQTIGLGTTDFGLINGLNAINEVSVNTSTILGKIVGGNVVLSGLQNIASSVSVSSLSLNGQNGGTLVGVVDGMGGKDAAKLTNLIAGYHGIFTMNGFILPVTNPTPPPSPPVINSNIITPTVVFPDTGIMQFGMHECLLGEDNTVWCH